VELRQLAVFVAVAEEGSFTRAADRLHVVQSAVSAGVRNLEGELGATLFDRTTHRVQLTDAGDALLPEARATLTAATAARDAVNAVRGGIRGTVLLGTMQAQGMRAIGIPELLAAFRDDHPLVQVHIRHAAGGSTEMATQVKEGQLDLAFVSLPAKVPGVELTPLTREPMMVLAPAKHRLAKQKSIPIAALVDESLAEFPAGWGLRMVSDHAFASAGLARTITFEVNDTASVIEFVRHGLALSLLPASFVGDRRGLVLIPIRKPVLEFSTAIAAPSNRRLNAAARILLETITTHTKRLT
jgi:DNA-binding transcriptional LysR family regulator